ncbi:Hypothetical predicted protein [Pelobates cultripes]|uniref:Uncharacterized protein n=1 Tax=Pelobates cultripes TaxID=61616 RepID=A0AAD1WN08_PELCU|nr:Hypothetical predicted protein [Pelobates cultripes]
MAAASTPGKLHCKSETEIHSEDVRSIEAAFARFWHKLNKKLQTPQATLQPLTGTSKHDRAHGEKRKVPPHKQTVHKNGVGNEGKRPPTLGTATDPKPAAQAQCLPRPRGNHRRSINHPAGGLPAAGGEDTPAPPEPNKGVSGPKIPPSIKAWGWRGTSTHNYCTDFTCLPIPDNNWPRTGMG